MITNLLNKVDTITHQFVFAGYQNLVSAYTPAIDGLIVLSIIVYGYAVVQGWVNLSLAETSKRLLLIGFVMDLALNWGYFSTYIYNLFTNEPNNIASYLLKSIPNSHFQDSNGVNSGLQQAWDDGMKFVMALWERGDWHHWFPFFWGAIIFFLVLLMVGIALIELIVAKFGLAIFLVLAPIAIPMLLFKPTKEIIFDGWVKHLVSFAFIPIFVTSALALGLTLLSDSSTDIQNAIQADTLTASDTGPYVIFSFVCIGLLLKATHMAASLASGFSTGMTPYLASAAGSLKRHLPQMRPGLSRQSPKVAMNPMPNPQPVAHPANLINKG